MWNINFSISRAEKTSRKSWDFQDLTVLFLKTPAHRIDFLVKRSIIAGNEYIACRFSCGIFAYSGYFQFGNNHCFFISRRKDFFRYISRIIRVHMPDNPLPRSRFREFLGNRWTLLFSNRNVLHVFPGNQCGSTRRFIYPLLRRKFWGFGRPDVDALFPPCCLISPHLAGSKIPARNRSHNCRNGLRPQLVPQEFAEQTDFVQ